MGSLSFIKNIFIDKAIKEKLSFLKNFNIFRKIEFHELSKIFNIMYSKAYEPGEIIFEEGKIGKAIFFIYSGKVQIFKTIKNKEIEIAILEPENCFGEMALLEELPRSATARTIKKTEVFLIYKANFDELIFTYPRLGLRLILNLVKILSSRIRNINQQIGKN